MSTIIYLSDDMTQQELLETAEAQRLQRELDARRKLTRAIVAARLSSAAGEAWDVKFS